MNKRVMELVREAGIEKEVTLSELGIIMKNYSEIEKTIAEIVLTKNFSKKIDYSLITRTVIQEFIEKGKENEQIKKNR